MSNKELFTVGIITASDKGAAGQREDLSAAAIRELLAPRDYEVVSYVVLPDDKETLSKEMIRLCDQQKVDLILTTGGTGFSMRDMTPEATMAVAHRDAPGIAQAMRMYSMQITKRAMLSRGVSVIRGETLIINLPGSPKAVKESLSFVIDELGHGLSILKGTTGECAR